MTVIIAQVAIQATRIIVPIIVVLGVVSNSLNIVILSRPNLNHHACSLYFLCLAVVNLFYSSVLLIINLLADGYQLNLSFHSPFFCKLISYLLNLCPNISIYLIVLASIDRYCASSIHAKIRRFSSVRVARWAIGLLVSTLALFTSWAFVAFDLEYLGLLRCGLESEILSNRVFLFILITLTVILAPFCMILFGVLTIQNSNAMHLNRDRISTLRRTESQLSRMLLLQVSVHIILVLPFCITYFMFALPISLRTTIEFYYVFIICKLPFYLTFTTAFFLYIISAQVYRNELSRLFRKLLPAHRIRPVQAITITNHNRLTAGIELAMVN